MSQSNTQNANDKWLEEQLARLQKCGELKYDWDGLQSYPPNTWAMDWMEKIIRFQHSIGFCKGTVMPDGEGGIVICIKEDTKYADIAVHNTGEILPLTEDVDLSLKCWNVNATYKEIKRAVNHIRTFLAEPHEQSA